MAPDRPIRPSRSVTRAVARRVRDQRGSGTVELVIATPLVLLLLGAIVQAALWAHAEHIAQAAAARGTEAARANGATPAAGHDQARTTLDALGGALRAPSIDVTRTATTTRTQIRGSALAVVPGVHLPVTAVAEAPTERFVPDNGGPP
jgi:Flp pilus assembly protein TadG